MKKLLRFVPLLVVYIIMVLLLSKETYQGDESRYVWFANNLAHGYYSPLDDINLWNGPGYPLVLLPFALLKLPLIYAKLLNAVLLFVAVQAFAAAVEVYGSRRTGTIAGYALGLYPSFYREMPQLMTESLTFALMALFIYAVARTFQAPASAKRWPWILGAGAALGYLCLTKVFMGYVAIVLLLATTTIWVIWRRRLWSNAFAITLLALVCCLPYLTYTYRLTGKALYWGNAGGLSLYWMSSPYETDLGDWHTHGAVYATPELAENHAEFFDHLTALDSIAKDAALRNQAIENIRKYPAKYLQNWLANVGRLLFNYPYSLTEQKVSTYYYMLPNMLLVVVFAFCLAAGVKGRQQVPDEAWFLLLLLAVALGGSSLLSAYERQFRVLGPLLGFWIALVGTRVVRITIRTDGCAEKDLS